MIISWAANISEKSQGYPAYPIGDVAEIHIPGKNRHLYLEPLLDLRDPYAWIVGKTQLRLCGEILVLIFPGI